MTECRRAIVAKELREMADSLWDVEYRVHVDEDAKLLREAAALLDTPTTGNR